MQTTVALRTIALAGNPNSGKTTLFNGLTGLRQKVGNYPGVTVERRTGRCLSPSGDVYQLIDLPGTYSLLARSPDEKVAVDVLSGRMPGTPKPDAVIIVLDASNLQRNLYLVSQIIEMGLPMVLALNMVDIAERRGQRIDPSRLSQDLGVPVVPVVGHKGRGLEELKHVIANAAVAHEPRWPLPEAMQHEVEQLEPILATRLGTDRLLPRALAERVLIEDASDDLLALQDPTIRGLAGAARERLQRMGIDPMQADVEAHYQWIEDVAASTVRSAVDLRVRGKSTVPENAQTHDSVLDYAGHASKPHLSEKADRILLHRVWGLLSFLAIMTGVFIAIFLLADPLMGFTEDGIGLLGSFIGNRMSDGMLKDLWTDGIVAGVGGVLVFVPQIAILFVLLAILEDSGYLARAAFLMDRLLAKVGLSGKAFVPLLSGFACAIPGVMATRSIESPRDRLRTIFVLPFMSCSARLPVYALLIGAFFAGYSWWIRGGIMLGLYLLGIAAALGTAWVWRRKSREPVSSFILELPSYKVPQASTVARVVWTNTWAFVARAGTIIFALSVILWALTYFPRLTPEARKPFEEKIALADAWLAGGDIPVWPEVQEATTPQLEAEPMSFSETLKHAEETRIPIDQPLTSGTTVIATEMKTSAETALASEQLRQSFAGKFGHAIEPVLKPLGFDWKMGVGLVGAFGAREVFVSFMNIVYATGGDEDNDTPLQDAMHSDTYSNGAKVWTPLVAINMLVWFVLAMQCLSTVAIVRRETGTWKWPLVQLAYMNVLAYVVCLAIFQIGSRMM